MLTAQKLRSARNPVFQVSSQKTTRPGPPFVRMASPESKATNSSPITVKVPRVLTVAGSDSGGGAGIQADIKTCAALGVFCTTAISALTAQNTIGVQGIHLVPAEFLEKQLRSVLSDIGTDVVKTGMLPSADCIETLCSVLDLFPVRAVVVDPVMVATSGHELAGAGILDALGKKLIPRSDVVTPNLHEASILLGGASVRTVEEMRNAAVEIHKMGPRYVLIKGGHLSGFDDVVDILYDGNNPSYNLLLKHMDYALYVRTHANSQLLTEIRRLYPASMSPRDEPEQNRNSWTDEALRSRKCRQFRLTTFPTHHLLGADGFEIHEYHASRLESRNTHGTGCSLASAIAAELAKGSHMRQAVQAAKSYVREALQKSAELEIGSGLQGPLNHLYELNHWESVGQSQFKPESLLLYAVTDSSMNKQWGRSMSEAVLAVIEGGATIVQIRDKEAESGRFLKEAVASLEVARKYRVPLVINDRIDIALACDADGVHLGQSDLPISRARAILGPKKIIGVSCKTPEQAQRAWEEGADYVGSGGVYPTNTKQNNKTIGVEGLRRVCEGSPLPVVAIGGIKDHNVKEVMASPRPKQLRGVAVVSGLFNQPDAAVAAKKFRAILAEALYKSDSRTA